MVRKVVRIRLDLRGKRALVQTFRAAARGRRALAQSTQVDKVYLRDSLKDGTLARLLSLPGFMDKAD